MTQVIPVLIWPGVAFAVALGLLLAAWRWRRLLVRRLRLGAVTGRDPGLAGLTALALVLAPVWVLLVAYLLAAFFGLGTAALAGEGLGRLASMGAAAAVAAALVALFLPPWFLVRAHGAAGNLRQESEDRAREALARAAEARAARFAEAVGTLGARRRVTRRHFSPAFQRLPGGRIRRDEAGAPILELDSAGNMIGTWEIWEEVEPDIEARLGALMTLERLARSGGADHIQVMDTICAYLRENSGVSGPDAPPPGEAPPRADIQHALRIIGRRSATQRAVEAAQSPPYRPDLTGAVLAGADLKGLDLGPVILQRADMRGAWLDDAGFAGADLEAADLTGVWAEGADFSGARLRDASLVEAWLVNARLDGASLAGADMADARMRSASLARADLDGALPDRTDIARADLTLTWLRGVDCTGFEGLTQTQLAPTIGDQTTRLPEGMARPRGWPATQVDALAAWRYWQEALAHDGAQKNGSR